MQEIFLFLFVLTLTQGGSENIELRDRFNKILWLFLLTKLTDSESLPDWLEILKSKVPQAPECGFDAPNRIVGGTVAGMTDFPWAVLIEYEKRKKLSFSSVPIDSHLPFQQLTTKKPFTVAVA